MDRPEDSPAPAAEHQAVWELLPWYRTETLAPGEARRVAAHVATCADCTAELAACDRMARAVRTADPLDAVAEASLARLRGRLAPRPRATSRFAWLGAAWGWVMRPRRPVFLVPGALAAAVAVAWLQPTPRPEFRTLTEPAPTAAAALPVRIAPEITEAALRTRLRVLGLRIVDGPDAADRYRLAPADGAPAWSAAALQGLLAAPEFRVDAGP